jgi:hypothetical protein
MSKLPEQARKSIDALQRYGATVTDHRRLSFDGNYHNDLSDELRLSGDILYHIFIFCDPVSLVNFGLSCKGAWNMIHGVTQVEEIIEKSGRLITPGGSCESPTTPTAPMWVEHNTEIVVTPPSQTTSPASPSSPLSASSSHFPQYPLTLTVADWLWQQMCFNYSQFSGTDKDWTLSPGCRSWKDEFRELVNYMFLPVRPQQQYGKFSNNFRTIKNTQVSDNWWETFRTRKAITPGRIYSWEICIDQLVKHQANTWWILIGIETPSFPYATQLHYEDVIGYNAQKHKGIGLNIGTGQIIHAASYTPYYDPEAMGGTISVGDVIGVKVDMRHTKKNNNTATIEFFRNRKSMGAVKRAIQGDIFYPTISLVNGQKVTIRYWNGSTRDPPPPNHLALMDDEECDITPDMFKGNEFQYQIYARKMHRKSIRQAIVKRLSLRSPKLSPLNTPNTPNTPQLFTNVGTPTTPTRRRDCNVM